MKLEAKDLRIGNFVWFDDTEPSFSSKYDIISELGESVCYVKARLRQQWYGNLRPIPLTEEWILRLGLIKMSNIHFRFPGIYLNGLHFIFSFGKLEYIYKIDGGHICLAELKYVHQLQNLYFALTGEELTLK